MIDWGLIMGGIKVGGLFKSELRAFAEGKTSRREFEELVQNFADLAVRSEVRKLLRTHGVTYARRLARKALNRR